jgi:hypothetical protein
LCDQGGEGGDIRALHSVVRGKVIQESIIGTLELPPRGDAFLDRLGDCDGLFVSLRVVVAISDIPSTDVNPTTANHAFVSSSVSFVSDGECPGRIIVISDRHDTGMRVRHIVLRGVLADKSDIIGETSERRWGEIPNISVGHDINGFVATVILGVPSVNLDTLDTTTSVDITVIPALGQDIRNHTVISSVFGGLVDDGA